MSLLRNLSKFGGRTAVNDLRRDLTYAQLFRASWALASQMQVRFRRAKLWPIESPKVLYMTNRDMLHPMAQFATWHLNGVCIPISSSCTPSEIEYYVKDSDADIIITHSSFAKRFESVSELTGVPVYSLKDDEIDLQTKSLLQRRCVAPPSSQDAMIIYTSGTTGSPKGAVHTHGSLEASMIAMQKEWQWTQNDHIANILPLHHVHGIMNVLNTSLWSGASCTLIPKYDDRKIWDILLDETDGVDLTLFMAVPAIYNRLMAHYENDGMESRDNEIKQKLKKMRLMVSGSSALPEKTFKKWQEITGHTLLERYGMTEVGMVLTNPQDAEKRIPRHVGLPFPGTEISFLDNDTNEIHNEIGRESELLVKSDQVFDRYIGRPEATAESFLVGENGDKWFKTGDQAVRSEEHDGIVQILGRLSMDIIKKQGYKISALEIESRLHQHEFIRESAVVGLPDEKYGEEIHAFVVLKSSAKVGAIQAEKQLDAYVREHMSSYKIPRVYHFIEELPRNQMGKISKLILKEQFQS